jgi:hypothetical protein
MTIGGEARSGAEQLAVFGVGPAHRQVGADLDGVLGGNGADTEKGPGHKGEKAGKAHAFPHFRCLMLVVGGVVGRGMKAYQSAAGNAVQACRIGMVAAAPSRGHYSSIPGLATIL